MLCQMNTFVLPMNYLIETKIFVYSYQLKIIYFNNNKLIFHFISQNTRNQLIIKICIFIKNKYFLLLINCFNLQQFIILQNQIHQLVIQTILMSFNLLIVSILLSIAVFPIYFLQPYSSKFNRDENILKLKDIIKQELQTKKIMFKLNASQIRKLDKYQIQQSEIYNITQGNSKNHEIGIQQLAQSLLEFEKSQSSLQSIHIITVLTQNTDISKQTVLNELNVPQLFQLSKQNVIIRIIPFSTDIFDKNMKNNFRKVEYVQKIINELEQSQYMKECRFTHKQCYNFVIYELDRLNPQDYYQYQGIFIVPQLKGNMLKQIIYNILNIDKIVHLLPDSDHKIEWYKYQYLLILKQAIAEIEYLQFIQKNQNNYIHSQQSSLLIEEWINEMNGMIIKFNLGEYHKIWNTQRKSLIDDERIGKIKMFPTDYFIGVYTPLLALALYPIIMLLKHLKSKYIKET